MKFNLILLSYLLGFFILPDKRRYGEATLIREDKAILTGFKFFATSYDLTKEFPQLDSWRNDIEVWKEIMGCSFYE